MNNLSVCGTDCSTCHFYGGMCTGCNNCEGKVFYLPEGAACAIYNCTVNNKKLTDCGRCNEMPCAVWQQTRDPKFSDKEFEENIKGRVQALKNQQHNKI